MKRIVILLALLILTSTFATVTIEGYVEVCSSCESADCGQVSIYREATGGRPIADTCISPNGYCSFEVDENDTYYIEVSYARNGNYDPGSHSANPCEIREWWQELDRVAVIVYTSDVTQDICCNDYGSEPYPTPCICEAKNE
jgi:hypothetical protein